MKQTEALVVGLGIAGVNLCHALSEACIPFHVIDPCLDEGSSFIAGGIYNPIVIKRKLKTWRADALFPELIRVYTAIDAQLGMGSLRHHVPIIKPIFSADELNEWTVATATGSLAPFLTASDITPPDANVAQRALAQINIRHSGFVDVRMLIRNYREHLRASGKLTMAKLDPMRTSVEEIGREHSVRASHVIWCNGADVRHHPQFSWLPLRPTKGQMLTVEAQTDLPRAIYNQNFYLLPGTGRVHRLGATYEWHDLYSGPTAEATAELCGRVDRTMRLSVRPLAAQTAVRPNVADRRPLLGTSPTSGSQHIFNGLGSKGVMLAPYFASQVVRHIWHGGPVDPEVDLTRFWGKWGPDGLRSPFGREAQV